MRALVDDEALDLVEHRRVRLVAVAAIGATRNDDADRRLLLEHGADLHRRGVRAQQQPRSVRLRVEEERVVHLPRRVSGGKLSMVKLYSSVSTSGPSAIAKPMSAKIAVSSSMAWLIG